MGRYGTRRSSRSWGYDDGGWPAYVPVAERQRRARAAVTKLAKQGRQISPVEIAGRRIATTFWGEAWCQNLESYGDYANRLPRGRTYVRNGSVLDLQIAAGAVHALVSGSSLYEVHVQIQRLAKRSWTELKGRCAGQIGSLVELLQGNIADHVMAVVTRKREGLFPSPSEISLKCSCPDWADMCKHVAATLYGVGARLDTEPALLFTLRGVDPDELVESALDQPTTRSSARKGRILADDELASVFGIDMDLEAATPKRAVAASKRKVTPKAKAPPEAKATPKAKATSRGKATSKAKATPKAKAMPKAKATSKANATARRGTRHRSVISPHSKSP